MDFGLLLVIFNEHRATIISRIADECGLAVSLSESREGGARFEFQQNSEEATC